MRKYATRGLINRTFISYKGKAEVFDRKQSKKRTVNFEFLTDKQNERFNSLEVTVQNNIDENNILINVLKCEKVELVYSMTKETFLEHAKVL